MQFLDRKASPLGVVLVFAAVAFTQVALATSSIDRMREENKIVLMVDIRRGGIVEPKPGYKCFYRYDAVVVDRLKGIFNKRQFAFYSESGLTMGEKYLIFFDTTGNREYRPTGDLVISDREIIEPGGGSYCSSRMNGLFLVYDEIHEVKEIWNGHALEKSVEFSDAISSFPKEDIRGKDNNFVVLSYIKSELSR